MSRIIINEEFKKNMDNINYWNNFYQNTDNLCPSQFVAFIVNEYPHMKNLIDFVCATARHNLI